jgi:hypothetical protein
MFSYFELLQSVFHSDFTIKIIYIYIYIYIYIFLAFLFVFARPSHAVFYFIIEIIKEVPQQKQGT